MDGTGCTGFALHLNDFDWGAKEVLLSFRRDGVDILGHWRRRGDWIDSCDFGEVVAFHRGSGVAIYGFEGLFDFRH